MKDKKINWVEIGEDNPETGYEERQKELAKQAEDAQDFFTPEMIEDEKK